MKVIHIPLLLLFKVQKNNLELKKFQPILFIIKLVRRDSKSPIANQILDWLNNRTMQSLFLSLPFFKNKKMENNVIIRGNNQKIKGILYPGQNKQIQFKNQDYKVYNQSSFLYY